MLLAPEVLVKGNKSGKMLCPQRLIQLHIFGKFSNKSMLHRIIGMLKWVLKLLYIKY